MDDGNRVNWMQTFIQKSLEEHFITKLTRPGPRKALLRESSKKSSKKLPKYVYHIYT